MINNHWRIRAGGIAPPGPDKYFNVTENKSSDRKLYFIFWNGIHENAFDITQNALIPQGLGDFAPVGTLHPAHPLGARSPDPRFAPPNKKFWIRH